MDGWNTSFLLGNPIFRCENVSFMECRIPRILKKDMVQLWKCDDAAEVAWNWLWENIERMLKALRKKWMPKGCDGAFRFKTPNVTSQGDRMIEGNY